MVLGRYGQTVYGMYGTNPEDTGTVTILACLLGCVLRLGRLHEMELNIFNSPFSAYILLVTPSSGSMSSVFFIRMLVS